MQTLVEKLQMNGILCHAGSRWGEKYFQFWPNAICESHLGFYLSEMDIFEKFQFWARSSFSDGLNLTSGNFLEREVFQNPQTPCAVSLKFRELKMVLVAPLVDYNSNICIKLSSLFLKLECV